MKTLLTPELAKKLLDAGGKNRPVKAGPLKMLCAAITEGKWRYNGESIVVSATGKLLDGQHRCIAVVQTGIAIEVELVSGVDDDVFDTFDGGSKRTASDVLGVESVKNAVLVAAAISIVDHFKHGRFASIARGGVRNEDVRALYAKYSGITRSVAVVGTTCLFCPASLLVALHYIFSEVDVGEADDFVHDLLSGEGLMKGDPVFELRKRLEKNAFSKAKLGRVEVAAIMVKAWNYRRTAKPMAKLLLWRSEGPAAENFPAVAGVVATG